MPFIAPFRVPRSPFRVPRSAFPVPYCSHFACEYCASMLSKIKSTYSRRDSKYLHSNRFFKKEGYQSHSQINTTRSRSHFPVYSAQFSLDAGCLLPADSMEITVGGVFLCRYSLWGQMAIDQDSLKNPAAEGQDGLRNKEHSSDRLFALVLWKTEVGAYATAFPLPSASTMNGGRLCFFVKQGILPPSGIRARQIPEEQIFFAL